LSKVKWFFGNFREATILLIVIVFCIFMAIASPHFFTWNNIITIFIGISTTALLVIAMTVVMASGGIDLSVGANMALSGTVTGYLIAVVGMDARAAMTIGILCSCMIGFMCGTILSRTSIAPMITTLGALNVSYGIAMIITKGSPISMTAAPEWFQFIGKGRIGDSIPVLIAIAFIFLLVFAILLYKSTSFRKAYYIGSNAQSAEFSGINVRRVKASIYVLSGLLAGLAGVMTISRFTVASPNAGAGIEMTVISACVIGGSSMSGGTGSIVGSFLGLMLLTFINNALILLNVSVYWQNLISGCILLIAVLIDYYSHRPKK